MHASNSPDAQLTIDVDAPARLHLGFIDPSGAASRRFGSLGLTLEGLSTRLRVAPAEVDTVRAASTTAQAEVARVQRHLAGLKQAFSFTGHLAVDLQEVILPHAGLGSGTQLALALGHAMARLAAHRTTSADIAALTDRGARSGIGVGCFDQGGFIVDGGRGPTTVIPPVISRLAFPEPWRVILLFDPTFRGMHGQAEVEAFRRLPPFPASEAAQLAQRCLMNVLPGLAEGDFPLFASAVTRIQSSVGDHFAPAQGGRYASPDVARWLDWFASEGATCYGQSSWGPTGFVIVADPDEARFRLEAAKARRDSGDPVRFRSVSGRNCGARISESVRKPVPV